VEEVDVGQLQGRGVELVVVVRDEEGLDGEEGDAGEGHVHAPARALGPGDERGGDEAEEEDVEQVRGQQRGQRVDRVRRWLVGRAEGAVRDDVGPERGVQQAERGRRVGELLPERRVERREVAPAHGVEAVEEHVRRHREPRARVLEDVGRRQGRQRCDEAGDDHDEEQVQREADARRGGADGRSLAGGADGAEEGDGTGEEPRADPDGKGDDAGGVSGAVIAAGEADLDMDTILTRLGGDRWRWSDEEQSDVEASDVKWP